MSSSLGTKAPCTTEHPTHFPHSALVHVHRALSCTCTRNLLKLTGGPRGSSKLSPGLGACCTLGLRFLASAPHTLPSQCTSPRPQSTALHLHSTSRCTFLMLLGNSTCCRLSKDTSGALHPGKSSLSPASPKVLPYCRTLLPLGQQPPKALVLTAHRVQLANSHHPSPSPS